MIGNENEDEWRMEWPSGWFRIGKALRERRRRERESERVNGGWSREKGRRRERVSDRRK